VIKGVASWIAAAAAAETWARAFAKRTMRSGRIKGEDGREHRHNDHFKRNA
jgi:hypothetical protein